MSTSKFLGMDIKKLFEAHTIKEIELIQKQIQQESERKKIELRTLVGERYRDLIQAADTIAEMKETSECVVSRICDIQDTFQHLQQKYLMGFKMEPDKEMLTRKSQHISDSVVMQIKILMDIPEHIWSAVDSKDFLLATKVFKIAQHIHFSLKFEVGNAELTSNYPIVGKQWGIINQFKTIIFNGCNNLLQSLDLSKESAANCLASLMLLADIPSTDLLNKFIAFRNQAIQFIISNENHHSVRNRIKLSLKMFMETVSLIHNCFIKSNDNRGLISQHINDINQVEATQILSQLDLDQDLLDKYLPSMTKMHKPFAKVEFTGVSLEDLKKNVKSWLDWTRNFISLEVSQLLDLVTSVKGVHIIREEALALQVPENSNSIWDDLSLPGVNFWSEFFQPLLTKRVKEIVADKWKESLMNLKTSVTELLIKVSNEKFEYPEHDLRWFVWKDSPTDIPQNLSKNMDLDHKRSLLMKAKGFSPNVIKLLENFDKSLYVLLTDLEQYLYETERVALPLKNNLLDINIYLVSNKFIDREEIQDNLQRISAEMMNKFIKFVKVDCIIKEGKFGKQDVNAIFCARFLQALTLLCPNLNKCFTLSKTSGTVTTNVKWQDMCEILKEESIFVWSTWAETFKLKIIKHQDWYLMREIVAGFKVDSMISEWEKVTIEEEAEEGKRIKSEILVPYQPSVHLQQYLSATCKDLNKIVPHSIPKIVLNQIIVKVVLSAIDYYEKLSANQELRQKLSIQILFDVKYVTLLMIPRENKILNEKSTSACNNVVAKIDPFDLDVFYPFIHKNVKKAVQRTLLMFGNLVPHLEQLLSVLGARTENSSEKSKSMQDPQGVLAFCTGAPWFPPLAITAPSRNLSLISVSMPEKSQKKKLKEHTRNDSTGAAIKSGAAAFFGAMGSDWFSTS
ncbi:conserved oligomeric Golgi complex subunit 1 isoform X1 [Leptopilina heterotoma]|uniref:conserved oligomeric Golgi complex subunit 1 isoform X1 n=2 Tax=Leptopilina heterotoma TaxID=63436 RepID=UPI001CA7E981|nr:conserved oligomeric Golgi complex subunit 1 isoform X1 [Leptopilina heterotoma]